MKDISYARISYPKKQFNKTKVVSLKFWINDRIIPPYVHRGEKYLEIENECSILRIFNPLQVSFEISQLVSYVRAVLPEYRSVETGAIKTLKKEKRGVRSNVPPL